MYSQNIPHSADRDAGPKRALRVSTLLLAASTLLAFGCRETGDVVEGEPRNADAMAYFSHPRQAPLLGESPQRHITAKIPFGAAASKPPVLVPNHRDQGLSDLAVDALARIGRPAVKQLVETLHDPNQAVRLRAINTLARIGPDARDAVAPLTKLLSENDAAVQRAAVHALGQIGAPAEGAVDALMRELRRPASGDAAGSN